MKDYLEIANKLEELVTSLKEVHSYEDLTINVNGTKCMVMARELRWFLYKQIDVYKEIAKMIEK